ncbi:MAG: member of Set1p complex, histone methyl transferase [Piccolia ochrophora]|nr:MAG: member of Set1p complex, histone methyl transferase [Piccolia ochrophora]
MAANAPQPSREPTARLSQTIGSYRPAKLFRPSPKNEISITSLDFDDTGELLIAACDDESLQLYNCKEGTHSKQLFSKKYGAHLARFTHAANSVLYASTKVNDTIRYLSTHDNKYIRYFNGHTAAVTSLSMSPGSDTFLSCSLDGTARLWALNTPNPTGKLILQSPTLTAYDPSAAVFAVASPSTRSLLLYDIRNYDKDPFATFDIQAAEAMLSTSPTSHAPLGSWTGLEFSNDGRSLLLATAGGGHILLDAFTGQASALMARNAGGTGRVTPADRSGSGVLGAGDVCFSPDARYLVGGQGNTKLCVWDAVVASNASEGARVQWPVYEIEAKHRVAVVAFNPRYNLCVTADKSVMLWTPDKDAMVE